MRALLVWLVSGWLLASACAQFSPDDPYYFPGVTGNITDSAYPGQWHLRNLLALSPGNAGLDANVWGAWQRGLTGAGVIISILDSGTQGNHPDLIENFRNDFSWDYSLTVAANNAAAWRGTPLLPLDNHGTAVAGVAAARGRNGIGVTGAAPFAGIAAQRLLIETPAGGVSHHQAEAWAIGFQGQRNLADELDPSVVFTGGVAPVRVMNHSYGFREGFVLDTDWELIHPALEQSAQRKVLHVFSAGNQRNEWPTQDAATNWNAVSPYGIVVAALGSDGRHADYSSFGANVLVTAPSNSLAPPGLFSISTTDRTGSDGYNSFEDGPDAFFAPVSTGDLGNYASNFGGTSSAAPLVAGILALGVEANPDLDLRMARHLLARTSRLVDADHADWITNAAGYHFNKSYGFGLIDADAFTLAATQVQSLSELTVYSEAPQILTGQHFGSGNLSLSQNLLVQHPAALPLEYVQVRLTLSGLQTDLTDYQNGVGAILGDLSAQLISPSGTSYALFSNDRNLIGGSFEPNRSLAAALDWTFISYAYFGEDLNGVWSISLQNSSTNTDFAHFGTWESFALSFGTGSLSVIPEPATWWLLLAALPCLRRTVRRPHPD